MCVLVWSSDSLGFVAIFCSLGGCSSTFSSLGEGLKVGGFRKSTEWKCSQYDANNKYADRLGSKTIRILDSSFLKPARVHSVPLFQTRPSMTSYWWLEISRGGRIYTTCIGKFYQSGSFFPELVYQHRTVSRPCIQAYPTISPRIRDQTFWKWNKERTNKALQNVLENKPKSNLGKNDLIVSCVFILLCYQSSTLKSTSDRHL